MTGEHDRKTFNRITMEELEGKNEKQLTIRAIDALNDIGEILNDGDHTMQDMREDIGALVITTDDIGNDLEEHVNNQAIHLPNPGAAANWRRHLTPRNAVVSTGAGGAILSLIYLISEVIKNA